MIQLGETLRLYVGYADLDTAVPLAPSTLTCTVTAPSGDISTITYPNVNFVRNFAGSYYIRILGNQLGTHYYRIQGQITTSDIDVRDGKFDVEGAP